MAFIVAWCGIVSAAGRYFIGVVADSRVAHLEHYRVDLASGKIWRFSYFNPASDRVRWYRIVIQPYT